MESLFDVAQGTQRWKRRVGRWQTVSEVVDPRRLEVRAVSERAAKQFILEHHYSNSYPAAKLRYGLIDTPSGRLMGVAVLGVPMQARVLTNVFPTLEPYGESLELSRLVLLDDPIVGANAESWMLARVFSDAAKCGVRGVVAFSDPQPRRHCDGHLVLPGHVGYIYQALNGHYLGRGTARILTVLPDATVLTDRSMSKVRQQERGHAYVEARLAELGASPRAAFESPSRWLTKALQDVGAVRVHHRGNHRYAWAIGPKTRRIQINADDRPFPKRIDPIPSVVERPLSPWTSWPGGGDLISMARPAEAAAQFELR